MRPLQTTVVVLAILAGIGGAIGMAMSFLYLAGGHPADNLAGASGFIAGAVLIAAGLISLALIAAAQKPPPSDDNPFRKTD